MSRTPWGSIPSSQRLAGTEKLAIIKSKYLRKRWARERLLERRREGRWVGTPDQQCNRIGVNDRTKDHDHEQ